MTTPILDKFLFEITRILREKNGAQLQDFLIVEPPLPPLYESIRTEVRRSFPAGVKQDALEAKCQTVLPSEGDEDATSWSSFVTFLVKYFSFLRDVDVTNQVETYDLLKALLNQCVLALSGPDGLMILPTVVALSKSLAALAIGLDKRPELIAHLTKRGASASGDSETGERITLVENSANVIREAFKKCLSERSGNASGLDSSGKPEGRRIGIYLTANLCLKLFFHCKKLRSAEQIFSNIHQQSPPLALFPASQRVTFLYYLGRYHFANNHFFRAQLALQAAYNKCHHRCVKQRRLILIYLITSNIILGRFPSRKLLERTEAQGLGEKFLPVCDSIKKGDLVTFTNLLSLNNESAGWFLSRRVLLQISNRCEVLVWRSLARRIFILSGTQGDAMSKRAPTLDLLDMLTLAIYFEKQILRLSSSSGDSSSHSNQRAHTNSIFLTQPSSKRADIVNGELNHSNDYVDPDLQDVVEPSGPDLPTIEVIESIVASLIEQDLLHGFISHKSQKFAITGSKTAGALQAGFPNIWETICGKADSEVPGWVMQEGKSKGGGLGGNFGTGRVVNMTGARPVGAGPA